MFKLAKCKVCSWIGMVRIKTNAKKIYCGASLCISQKFKSPTQKEREEYLINRKSIRI